MYSRTSWRLGLTVLVLLSAVEIFLPMSARADTLDLSLQLPASVSAGGAGTFNVVLADMSAPGGTGVTIGGFDFEVVVETPDSGVTLTGAEPTLTGYIFSGNSFVETFGVPLNITSTPTTDLIANDEALTGGTTLTGGESVDLGEVSFDVSSTAPTEMVDIDFGATTDLSDDSNPANPITINNLTGGTLDITGATTAVPEPSTLILLLSVFPFALLIGLRTRPKFEG
jgi:hypothetical protein